MPQRGLLKTLSPGYFDSRSKILGIAGISRFLTHAFLRTPAVPKEKARLLKINPVFQVLTSVSYSSFRSQLGCGVTYYEELCGA